ncbi:MAG: hypothetical protein HY716_13350 [Planctomycetes bacterium]|nr:hypothetical protein [Planctomycetota bacterium]
MAVLIRTHIAVESWENKRNFIAGIDRIAVDLRSSQTLKKLHEMRDVVKEGLDHVQRYELSGRSWDATIVCKKDRYTVAALDSRTVDGRVVEDLVLFVRARANELK